MIFFSKDKVEVIKPRPQNGAGEVCGRHPFRAEERPERSRVKMIGEMTLSPGSAIGFHVHENDEEVYMIVSGRGLFTDNDQSTHPVGPGDVTLTRKGEGHGLANAGPEPLVFTALIAE